MKYRHAPLTPRPGDQALAEILSHIAVSAEVLREAKRRRDLVCRLAMEHPASRDTWYSGSIAHGTENSPLGDADCGVMVSRVAPEYRAFGPDAGDDGRGPEEFIQSFAAFILPRLRGAGYPRAEVDLTGNRAIKFEFNEQVDFDELEVAVDPFVDLIVGLDRREGPGIWIPNRKKRGWDAAHPQKHTELMTQRDAEELRVHRAHLIRLSKRAIKADGLRQGVAAMCSWNVSALALEHVRTRGPLAITLSRSLRAAAHSIAAGPTDDPAGVADPIKLPDGMTNSEAAVRLSRMADVVERASEAEDIFQAQRILSQVFGGELDEIRAKRQADLRRHPLNAALRSRDAAAVGAAVGIDGPLKATSSHGARRC